MRGSGHYGARAAVTLALAMAVGLVGCSGVGSCSAASVASSAESTEVATGTSGSEVAQTSATEAVEDTLKFLENDDLANAFAGLDGVTEVHKIDGSFQYYTAKYLLTFEQPLDWDDLSAGTFPQRVTVGVVASPAATVMETNGYMIQDASLATDDASSLARAMQTNYVGVEHRFFGSSRPEGLTNDVVEGWQYLTAANATADLHKVYQELSQVIEGRWVASGSSRGGQLCEAYAASYPTDMAFYVPMAAPCSSGPSDSRMYEFVYTAIGDEKYGAEQAAAYRQTVLDFQVACMRRKSELAGKLRSVSDALLQVMGMEAATYREQVTDDKLFDIVVAEFAVQLWQYTQNFDHVSSVVEMPEGTPEEEAAKSEALLNTLIAISNPVDFSARCAPWPYYVGAAKEYGQYRYDLSYLRAACAEAGIPDAITVTEDEEESIIYDLVLTPEQKAAFAYSDELHRALDEWVDTTESNVLMIYGASDPWYGMRIHDTDNPHVHVFVDRQMSHGAGIFTLEEADSAEAMALLREWLGMGSLEDHA